MKIIYLAIIYLLFTSASPNTQNRKVSQNIQLNPHIHTLITELNGEVELVYWNEDQIRIETTIQSNLNSDYGLDYTVNRHDYNLIANFAEKDHSLILRSKKVHPSIIIKGQIQKTRQYYKVFVPTAIQHIQ